MPATQEWTDPDTGKKHAWTRVGVIVQREVDTSSFRRKTERPDVTFRLMDVMKDDETAVTSLYRGYMYVTVTTLRAGGYGLHFPSTTLDPEQAIAAIEAFRMAGAEIRNNEADDAEEAEKKTKAKAFNDEVEAIAQAAES
jgi:hypothetical protein